MRSLTGRLNEYQVIGRHLPTEANPTPKLYRMRIFAPNTVVAKSRFWYFLMKLRKVKKANGEIISLNVIHEKRPMKVKNFGVWIRYDSRSGTHNMYKEYREMSRTEAVEALYQDMAARHRARFRSIHILKVVELEKTDDVKRPYIKQLLTKDLKFPLPHRVPKESPVNAPPSGSSTGRAASPTVPGGPRTVMRRKAAADRADKVANTRPSSTRSAGAGGSSSTMLRLYTDESPGLKVDPVVVLVLSLGFIFSVVALHIIAKITRKFSA
ncbi:MAG: 60S ribosomal protein L20 [Sclerophora amabilis]|nr:MAG: 60S ribosomal protein L20 [Sclerophora amabilis]